VLEGILLDDAQIKFRSCKFHEFLDKA
jgi:hypothetical protein